ncbi:MAG: hypothetical protein PUF10_11790 [Bacteroidales bacterium]|nr:hypothetical protein [Bacteroidales bacterium]
MHDYKVHRKPNPDTLDETLPNAVAAIAAYCYFPKKPSISLERYEDNQLVLF